MRYGKPNGIKNNKLYTGIFLLLSLFSSGGIIADEKARFIQLPAQALAEQLAEISKIFDCSFIAPSDHLTAKKGSELKGRYTLQQALDELFLNNNLTAYVTDNGFVVRVDDANKQQAALDDIDEITTTGSYEAASQSLQYKQNSKHISDVIAGQDLSSYPDVTVAESLQRVPGITITRALGEGRQVSLRGVYPDFTLVTLNGMPALSNNDLPMDSRLQKEQNRSFDFNIFSPKLFESVQVRKSYSSEQTSGGLAGTIALQTDKPFKKPGARFELDAGLGRNQFRDNPDKRLSAVLSNTWNNWGALLSVNWGERNVQEQGANTFRWRPLSPNADLSGIDEDLADKWRSGDIVMPRGNRYSVWQIDQTRFGGNLALQYQREGLELSFDWVSATLEGTRRENHLYPRGSAMTPIIEGITKVTTAEINARNELVYARYENASIAAESRQQQVKTDYNQWITRGLFELNRVLDIGWQLGLQQSDYSIPFSAKVFTRQQGDVSIDYRKDRYFAHINYASDLTQPEQWFFDELDLELYDSFTQQKQLKFFSEYSPNAGASYQLGIEVNQQESQRIWSTQNDVLSGYFKNSDVVLENALSYRFSRHSKIPWTELDVPAVLNHFSVNGTELSSNAPPIETTRNLIQETNWEAFFQTDWLWKNWQLLAGARVVESRTDINSNEPILQQKLSSSNVLPAINATYFYSDSWQLRASLSRSIARPLFSDLTPRLIQQGTSQTLVKASDELSPYVSSNFDLSAAYYGDNALFFSAAWFYKDLDDYIASERLNAGTDQPALNIIERKNSESAWLSGLEAQLQWRWSFLPAPFNNLGVNLQGTLNKGEVAFYDENTGNKLFKKDFPYLSEHTAAVALYYEDANFLARISATHRDDYIARVDSQTLSDEDETGFHASTYVDASVSWAFNSSWELGLEFSNLTNEREEQYSNSTHRAYNSTSYGRNVFLGITYRH
ncbi:TonB-dependent receptor [Idiomarina sp. M1R2S28]|uniref:TonB-dependent receptor n=1 Tax=Idiomarina rhizosphaerae TaxID=2961572 RepID=A0A9X2FVI1_9GAMM|nr:TonB-dependent receptor [Idiomarina rhizosphaerae]MCP1338410.1 TonB-dependent receptor [Idiomarina rhizosphaerae]